MFSIGYKKVHSKTLCKPWITPEIQTLIKKKNKQFSIKNNNKTANNKKKYKEMIDKVTKVIADEKEKYYKNLLDKTNNNIKQKWNAIRLIINRSKIQQSNCIIPNNILGRHYSTLAQKLADKLPNMTKNDIPTTSSGNKKLKILVKHSLHLITSQAEKYMNVYLN